MTEPAQIRTDRLLLRRPLPEDESDFVDVHTNPDTHPHRPGGARTREESLAILRDFHAQWDRDGVSYWTLVLAATGEILGFGGLRHAEEEGRPVLNLYYRLHPSARGNGYAPEMGRAALEWARRARPDRPVVIVTRPDNAPSLRVADKLGFVHWTDRERDGLPEVVYRTP